MGSGNTRVGAGGTLPLAIPFEAFIENSPALAFVKDEGGRYVYVNEPYLRFFRTSIDAVQGKTDAELFGPVTAQQLRTHDARVLAGNDTVELQETVPGPDGTPHHWLVLKFPFTDPAGRRFLGGMAVNITERQRAHEAIVLVSEAATELARIKTELVANVSHELRTPLNGVIGFVQLALETELTAEQRDYLTTAESCGDALLGLITDLLDFSRIEAGKMTVERVPFAVREALADALKPLELAATKKGLQLGSTCDAAVPGTVFGDPARLRQVVVNLVANAVKFTETGEVAVHVARDAAAPDRRLHVTVRDTGIGIPPEKQETIFQPFIQGDGSTTRRYGGTGLGLSIASQLVETMGGRMWIESAVGRGSTFHFTLPALDPAGVAAPAPPAASGPTAAGRGTRHALRALVADHNRVDRDLVRRLLERRGHHVVTVTNGAQALLTLAEGAFDIVFLSLEMPILGGLEAAAAIRAGERGTDAHLPIVGLTADALAEAHGRCRAAGMDGSLAKPIAAPRLDGLLEQLAPARAPAPAIRSATGRG